MKEENIKDLNIYEKLSLITEEIGVVEKKSTVGTGVNKYKAVSERDVLDNIKPIEKKHRVYSYPVSREIIESDTLVKETEYNGETKRINQSFMRIKTIYRFINLDKPEEFIETTVYGDGIDTGDKAPGKAMTYADKYALMKAYKISTGDDPDKEVSPEAGYTKKDTTDYRSILAAKLKEAGKLEEYAKKYKLNAKTPQSKCKELLEELSGNKDASSNDR